MIIDTLLQIRVDGIIASVAKETEDFTYFEKIKNWQVPLILYDRIGDDIGVSSIVNDDYQGAFKVVTHLIEQGFEKIAHFAGQQHIKIYRDRFKGYLHALKEHNLEINEQFIIESDLIDEPNIILEAGYEMTNRLLGCEDPPDGIFSSSDFAAMGAIKALKKRGIAIPHEVALVGFSNDFASSVVDPGLSSLDQHTKQMGIQAAKLFLEEVNNPNERFSPRSIVIEPKLIIRESSNMYKASKVNML